MASIRGSARSTFSPLIPIKGISMEETASLATKLGQRIGEELGISVYLYEKSAQKEERQNLATVRHGEI